MDENAIRSMVGALRLPVMAAPMTGVSTPQLVAEACAAGVLGGFPTSNAASSQQLEEWFDEIDEGIVSSDAPHAPAPVVANLIVGRQNIRLDADVECVTRRRVPLVVTSVGSPKPVIGPLHDAGCLVLADVASMTHAHKALDAGADGLVLLAAGAGGHTGWANPLAFVRAVRSFYEGPLAVAGGMSDGTALWAAICAGYDLGFFGTRFIGTTASAAGDTWRQALVESTMDDITLATAANGVAASTMRGGGGSAGHTVGSVRSTTTVAALVDEIEADWHAARDRTAALLATHLGGAR